MSWLTAPSGHGPGLGLLGTATQSHGQPGPKQLAQTTEEHLGRK